MKLDWFASLRGKPIQVSCSFLIMIVEEKVVNC